ncbi:MAG: uncharacterized protein K0Q72_333, partial [Armatimonadetes bacterium]|nr:uncharacterized protein [Armatimonadota bacterium]
VYRTIGFVHALRHHLRQTDPFTELPSYLPPEEIPSLRSQRNVPLAVLQGIAERLVWARKQGWIHPYHVAILESSLTELINLQGACERIKSTPVPFTYTVLSHRIVAFFCFFLPFGIVDTVGLLTPLVVFLVSHAFFGLDVIGDEIEEPFGVESHHLPLTALCRTIEVNLRQMLGESEVPPFLQPVDGVLM